MHTFVNRHSPANDNLLLNPKCQKVFYIQRHLTAFDILSLLVCSLTDVDLCHRWKNPPGYVDMLQLRKILSNSKTNKMEIVPVYGPVCHTDFRNVSCFQVALVYHVDDPINFMTSFYGCLIAGIIPVPIEPPASKDVSLFFGYLQYCNLH